jgi:hypothetical protein
MVVRITIRNKGNYHFYYSFQVFNTKVSEPFNLNKLVFSGKREYLYEKDMEIELRDHPELKRAYRVYQCFGVPRSSPCIPTGHHVDFFP